MSQARQILDRCLASYEGTCILGAAAELDLFSPLTKTSMTAATVAGQRGVAVRGVERLFDALTAFGVLQKTTDREPVYRLADGFDELLDLDHANSFVPMLRHRMTCVRRWVELARVVKTDAPVETPPSLLGKGEDYRSFVLAMNSIGILVVPGVIESLKKIGCLHFRHLLDVGGASGTYTLAMLEANPSAKATIFDLPVAIAEAKKRFQGTKFESNVTFAAGDFYVDELPTGADFVWLSAIIHQFDRQSAQALYRKIFRAMEPGGTLAVRDFVMQSDRTSPAGGTLFAINMLVGTENGMCYTFDEIREDLEIAGFHDIKYAVPSEGMNAVVTAVK